MAAFPARDERHAKGERRDEAPAQGEISPQLKRALQIANAARARAARIRSENQASYSEPPPARPPGLARVPSPCAPSSADVGPCAPAEGHATPAEAKPVVSPQPPDLEPGRPAPNAPDPGSAPSAGAAPAEPADAAPASVATATGASHRSAEAEPATPAASPSEGIEPPSSGVAEAGPARDRPRFARTLAAIQANRMSKWVGGPTEPGPRETKKAWPRPGAAAGSSAPAAAAPAVETAQPRPLPESLGQISPGQSRRAGSAKSPARSDEGPAAGSDRDIVHQDPPPGTAATSAAAEAPERRATTATEAPAKPGRRGIWAAYRSLRNSIALIVVVGAVLLAGLRSDGTLDVVRSVWSMKPPRVVTVERMLTLDLPPFREVVEVHPRPAPDARDLRADGTVPPSATGGGDGVAVLDLVKDAAVHDPRIADLAAIVRRDPSRWDAFYRLGHVMQSRGDLAVAERLYRQGRSLNPRHAAIAYDLGYVMQRQGDIQGAEEHYRAAIALKPDYAHALYNLGALLRRQGAYVEAGALFERAVDLQRDNPDLYYEWARTLEARGRAERAIDLYRQAVALSPDRWPGPDARARMQTLLSEGPQTVGSRS